MLSRFSHKSRGFLQEFHLGLSLLFSLFYNDLSLISPDLSLISPGLSLIGPDLGLISPDLGLIGPDLGLIDPDLSLIGLDLGLFGLDLGLLSHDLGLLDPLCFKSFKTLSGHQALVLQFLYQCLKIIKFFREMISLLYHYWNNFLMCYFYNIRY